MFKKILAGMAAMVMIFGSGVVLDGSYETLFSVTAEAEAFTQDGFTFEYETVYEWDDSSIKHIVITNVKGDGKELKIPNEIGGIPVAAVNQGFLGEHGDEGIESIYFPENFMGICDIPRDENGDFRRDEDTGKILMYAWGVNDAYGQCYDYHFFTFAYFYTNDVFKEYKVDEKNPYYSTIDGVLTDKEKKVLISYPINKGEEYVIPDCIENVCARAFHCAKIKKLTISKNTNFEDGLLGVPSENTFDQKTQTNTGKVGISWYSFQSSYPEQKSSAFRFIDGLQEIAVSKENKYYYMQDGCLYKHGERPGELKQVERTVEGDGIGGGYIDWEYGDPTPIKALIWCPPEYKDTEFTVPSDVQVISGFAFANNNNIEKINVPETVECIMSNAFYLSSAKEINIKGDYKDQFITGGNAVLGGASAPYPIYYGLNTGFAPCCENLEKITVSTKEELNEEGKTTKRVFKNDDHILWETFTGYDTPDVLMCYFPASKDRVYEIPQNIGTVGECAFTMAKNLRYIVVPEKTELSSWGTTDVYFAGCSEDLTLIVKKGSSAETYAKEHGIKYLYELPKDAYDEPIIKGDPNGDNEINVTDIAVTAAHIKGIKALDESAVKAADVNGDTEVNVTDIAMIAAHIKGIKAIG